LDPSQSQLGQVAVPIRNEGTISHIIVFTG